MPVVRVLGGEYVVPHGTTTTAWSVHSGGAWVSVARAPGWTREAVSAGPGTIWQALFECELPAGTWLLRIDTTPLPERHADPLAYLEREVRTARKRFRRRFYRLAPNGELLSAEASRAPA